MLQYYVVSARYLLFHHFLGIVTVNFCISFGHFEIYTTVVFYY